MTLLQLNPFPIRDQLHPLQAPKDGQAPENARMDCVFDSFSACVEQQTGLALVGDDIKDFVKGQRYVGGGNAAWLEGANASHFGVRIAPFQSTDQHRLIAAIRDYLEQGVPALVTIPSAWNSQPNVRGYNPLKPSFSSHVCVAYGIDAGLNPDGACWLMNPWPESYFVQGHRQKETVAWLQRRLCYGAVWPVQALPKEWHDIVAIPSHEDNGSQMRKKGGKFVIAKGFRKFCLLHPEIFNGIFADEEAEENEVSSPTLSTQRLKYVTLIWTPATGVQLMANKLVA